MIFVLISPNISEYLWRTFWHIFRLIFGRIWANFELNFGWFSIEFGANIDNYLALLANFYALKIKCCFGSILFFFLTASRSLFVYKKIDFGSKKCHAMKCWVLCQKKGPSQNNETIFGPSSLKYRNGHNFLAQKHTQQKRLIQTLKLVPFCFQRPFYKNSTVLPCNAIYLFLPILRILFSQIFTKIKLKTDPNPV